MMSWLERLFCLCLFVAFVVVVIACVKTAVVSDAVFAVALTILICGIVVIFLVNLWPEKPRPNRGDIDNG